MYYHCLGFCSQNVLYLCNMKQSLPHVLIIHSAICDCIQGQFLSEATVSMGNLSTDLPLYLVA
jgi:hypothetical protein